MGRHPVPGSGHVAAGRVVAAALIGVVEFVLRDPCQMVWRRGRNRQVRVEDFRSKGPTFGKLLELGCQGP